MSLSIREAIKFHGDDSGLLSCVQLFWDLFSKAVSASWLGGLLFIPTNRACLSVSLPASIFCSSSTLAIKLTYLFVFFLSGYLESEATVAIEICGQSDALLPWGRGMTQWAGLFGRHPVAKGAGRRQGRQLKSGYLPVPTEQSPGASEMGLVFGVSS